MKRAVIGAFAAIGFAVGLYASRSSPPPTSSLPALVVKDVDLQRYQRLQDRLSRFIHASEQAEDMRADQYQATLRAIDAEITRRHAAIERAADVLLGVEGCGDYPEQNPEQHRGELLDLLYRDAEEFAARTELSRAATELQLMRQDPLRLEIEAGFPHLAFVGPANERSLFQLVASTRRYERCLGNYGRGAFDMYRDFLAAVQSNECEAAEAIADELDDPERRLLSRHRCISMERYADALLEEHDVDAVLAERRERYFNLVATLSEEDLLFSARVLTTTDEFSPWLDACLINRGATRYASSQPFAFCLATLVDARRWKDGPPRPDTLQLGYEDVNAVALTVPSLRGDTRCSLEFFLSRAVSVDRRIRLPEGGISAECFGEH